MWRIQKEKKKKKVKETLKRRFHFKMGQMMQYQEFRYANQLK